jgi:hypothetical protein
LLVKRILNRLFHFIIALEKNIDLELRL